MYTRKNAMPTVAVLPSDLLEAVLKWVPKPCCGRNVCCWVSCVAKEWRRLRGRRLRCEQLRLLSLCCAYSRYEFKYDKLNNRYQLHPYVGRRSWMVNLFLLRFTINHTQSTHTSLLTITYVHCTLLEARNL